MFDQTPRWCPCGCSSSYVFECGGVAAPRGGQRLYYTCPGSRDLLSFRSSGNWVASHPKGRYKVVKASLTI
jgi:hypothetical protein